MGSRSTINAHYTDPDLMRVMWDALNQSGFDGGTVLEPGSGSGNFLGAIPEDLLSTTHLTGVEVDPISANISRALYPDANVRTESFADSPFPSGSFDAAIGNVPFGSVRCTTSATTRPIFRSTTTSSSRPSICSVPAARVL